ncbi:MAG: hypothetical protein ABF876_18755 [Acetobacter aceti]
MRYAATARLATLSILDATCCHTRAAGWHVMLYVTDQQKLSSWD